MERPLPRVLQHTTPPVLDSIHHDPITGSSIGDSDSSGEDERYYFSEQASGNGNGKRARGDSLDQDRPTKIKARNKYVSRACLDCQRRKVKVCHSCSTLPLVETNVACGKCSGEDTCLHCRARDARCVYLARGNRGGRRKGTQKTVKNTRNLPLVAASKQPSAPSVNGTIPSSQGTVDDGDSLLERLRVLEGKMCEFAQLAPRLFSTVFEAPESPLMTSFNPLRQSSEQSQPPNPHSNAGNPSLADPLELPNHLSLPSDQPSPETDTFEPNSSEPISLSISSQLRRLREGVGSMSGQEASPRVLLPEPGQVIVQLPKPARLHHLLQLYFRDYDCYFPYLDESTTETRIFKNLEELHYGENNCTLFVGDEHSSLLALLCNMLAIAEIFDPQVGIREGFKPGWCMYLQGLHIIHQSRTTHIGLDLVRYHTMTAGYFIMSENLSAASHAILKAYQLASKFKMNDQKAWVGCSKEERRDRQKLWWIIYFIDRRISQKNGTAYIIRDSEIAVEEFTERPTERKAKETGNMTSADAENGYLSTDDSVVYKYLQILVNLGRIWGQIWDTFFSVMTKKLGDQQEIEIMDTRLVFLQRSIPPELGWDLKTVAENVEMGEVETHLRRRLGIYVRINLLRMIIHQNPLFEGTTAPETKKFCAELAMKTVEAISTFTKLFPSRPSAYFNTASLVECIYQLMPFLRDQTNREGNKAALSSFREARSLLSDLSRLTEGAKRALSALESVDIEDEDAIASDTIRLGSESCAMIQNELQPQYQTYDANYLLLPDASEYRSHHMRMESLNMWSQFSLDGNTMPREVSSMNGSGLPLSPLSNLDFFSIRDFAPTYAAHSGDLSY